MTNWKLTIAYDGSQFQGYQIQPTGETVEKWLKYSATEFFGNNYKMTSAGRTDTGVHAEGQVIAVSTEREFTVNQVLSGFPARLPASIQLKKAEIVDPSFHARFSATKRSYRYLFSQDKVPLWLDSRVAHVRMDVDEKLLEEMTSYIIGEHDFNAFRNMGSEEHSTVRTVFECLVNPISLSNPYEDKDFPCYVFSISANGFLYRMVRNLMGSMFEILKGKATLAEFQQKIRTGKRQYHYMAAPAKGLCLTTVCYE